MHQEQLGSSVFCPTVQHADPSSHKFVHPTFQMVDNLPPKPQLLMNSFKKDLSESTFKILCMKTDCHKEWFRSTDFPVEVH